MSDNKVSCNICLSEFDFFKMLQFGCCSFRCCVDCYNKLKSDKCPQCQKHFFNCIKNETIKNLEEGNKELRNTIFKLNEKINLNSAIETEYNLNKLDINKKAYIILTNKLETIIKKYIKYEEMSDFELLDFRGRYEIDCNNIVNDKLYKISKLIEIKCDNDSEKIINQYYYDKNSDLYISYNNLRFNIMNEMHKRHL
jgi:hypothetical protein